MADLIDRDALMKKICGNECGSVCDEECENAACNFYDYIMDAPTIEPEVRHGRWIPVDGEPYAKCSYCGEKHYGCTTPYCDMCGACMRKEGADNVHG